MSNNQDKILTIITRYMYKLITKREVYPIGCGHKQKNYKPYSTIGRKTTCRI